MPDLFSIIPLIIAKGGKLAAFRDQVSNESKYEEGEVRVLQVQVPVFCLKRPAVGK